MRRYHRLIEKNKYIGLSKGSPQNQRIPPPPSDKIFCLATLTVLVSIRMTYLHLIDLVVRVKSNFIYWIHLFRFKYFPKVNCTINCNIELCSMPLSSTVVGGNFEIWLAENSQNRRFHVVPLPSLAKYLPIEIKNILLSPSNKQISTTRFHSSQKRREEGERRILKGHWIHSKVCNLK